MITIQSPIIAKNTGLESAQAIAFAERVVPAGVAESNVNAYLGELNRLCRLVGFDFRILAAQSAHETADWSSSWWTERLNPAGIGITGDPDQDAASHTWKSGTEAARAHVVHMSAYVWGNVTGNPKRRVLLDYMRLDPRWNAVVEAGYAGSVDVLGDLGSGKWAADPDYAPQIAAKANLIFKEVSVPTTDVVFGRVPKPPIASLICSKIGPGHGYYEMGHPRQNVGICEHITDGYGSIEFYHGFFSIGGEREADALVDFVVGRDGRIGMLNDPFGSRAGYANGDTSGLEGDGPAFMAHFAGELDPPNFHLISIEHEGKAADDWTGPQWNASVALDAWLFDQLHVRYDAFPRNQNTGIAAHYFHSEFTGKGGNGLDECPGRYIKQHIDQFQAEVKAVLMAHQVTATQTEKPSIPTVPWGKDATGEQDLHGTKALAFYGSARNKRTKDLPVYVAADSKSRVLARVKSGGDVTIRGTVRTQKGRWALVEVPGVAGVGRCVLSALTGPWPVP